MPTNVDQFVRSLRTVGLTIDKRINDTKRKVALQALSTITVATPVLTGRARGNWQVSLDQPITAPTEQTDKNGSVDGNECRWNEQRSHEFDPL